MKKNFLFVMFLLLVLLASCTQQKKEIKDIIIIDLPEEIEIGEFDNSGIKFEIIYTDDTTEVEDVTEEKIPQEYRHYLYEEGTHNFSFLYRGIEVTFELKIKISGYKITFVNVLNEVVKVQSFKSGDNINFPTSDQMYVEGYKFLSTFDYDGSEILSDIIIKGNYVKTWTVNFYNGMGKIISTQIVDDKSGAIEPSDVEKQIEGYKFVKWDRDFGYITSNIDIYGIYEKNQETDGDIVYQLNPDGKSYCVVNVSISPNNIVIPEKYNNLPVTVIGPDAFIGYNLDDPNITITIPNSIKKIYNTLFLYSEISFYYNGTLDDWCKIEIDNDEVIIGPEFLLNTGYFRGIYEDITYEILNQSDNYESYKRRNKYDLEWLTYEYLPDNNIFMLDDNDQYYEIKDELIIPESITSINEYQFAFFSEIERVIFINCESSIGKGSFLGCVSLEDIEIEIQTNQSISIDEAAFAGCISLDDININGNISNIKSFAFYGCKNLSYLDFNVFIKDNCSLIIGDYAFLCCSDVTEIEFGKNVNYIGKFAFAMCISLCNVSNVENANVEVGAFEYCINLNFNINENMQYLGSNENPYALLMRPLDSNITNIILPDGCMNIAIGALDECSNLNFNQYDNGLYLGNSTNDYAILIKPINTNIEYIEINSDTKSVVYGALNECNSLKEISIPFIGLNSNSISNTHFGYIFGSISYLQNNTFVPSSLKKVILTSAMFIGDNGFYGCNNLETIIIPNTIAKIGINAFAGCDNLQLNSYDNGLYIGSNENPYLLLVKPTNDNIETIEINPNTMYVSFGALYNCNNLKSIKTHFIGECDDSDSNTHFGYIFGAKVSWENDQFIPSSLNEVIITNVDSIKENSFNRCSSLESIIIPNSVTSIGDSAFSGCTGLTSIIIPDSVTSIGRYAFESCTSLTTLVIPDGVTSIYSGAFFGCSSLKNIEISNTVLSIESSILMNCNNLESLTMPFVQSYDIYNHNNTIGYYFGATESIFDNNKWVPQSLKKVIINGGDTLATPVFYGCSSLTTIEIPNSVTSIGFGIFEKCSGLINISLPIISYNDGGYSLACLFGNVHLPEELEELYLSGGTIIDENVLSGFNIKKLYMSKSITHFKSNADCYIENVYYNGTIEDWCKITYESYGCCEHIYMLDDTNNYYEIKENLILPNTITTISFGVFERCSNLENVYYNGTIEDWCNIKLENSNSNPMKYAEHFYMLDNDNNYYEVTGIEIPNTITSIKDYQFNGFNNITTIEIPSSVTSIGTSAFSNCSSLTTIEIPSSVTSIGSHAFNRCTNLTNITIPESVTSIGDSAFHDCDSLTNITIPESVTSIGYGAFESCSSLTSITIPSSVTSIGNYAFESCSSLTSIIIPNSVTSIGKAAFRRCTSLTNITIPNEVLSVGNNAFSYSNIENLYYNGTIEEYNNINFGNLESHPESYAKHFYVLDVNGEYYEYVKN